MWHKILIWLAAFLVIAGGVIVAAISEDTEIQERAEPPILTCDTITLGRQGKGIEYKGTVQNSDYRFSATLPDHLVGWGAGPTAPFHGFTIYFSGGSNQMSCINFSISKYIDLGDEQEANQETPHTVKVRVGNRVGTLSSASGISEGVPFDNYTVSLSVPRSSGQDLVSVTLVTPKQDARKTKPVFDRFLSHLYFR
jgi:hypothetical protein